MDEPTGHNDPRILHIEILDSTPPEKHTYVAFPLIGRACSCGHMSGNIPNLREQL